MRVDHGLGVGPFEEGEATVLRCYKGDGITLVLHELCRGQMPCPAELFRMDQGGGAAFDRLRNQDLIDQGRSLAPGNLCTEAEQVVLVRKDDRAVHRGESGYGIDSSGECFLRYAPAIAGRYLATQSGQFQIWRRH